MKLFVHLLLPLTSIATARDAKYLFGPGVRNIGSNNRASFCNLIQDDLDNGLAGVDLSIVVQRDIYFVHDETEEVSARNPSGILADLLDELSLRANFTWRRSFLSYDERTVDSLFDRQNKHKWDDMLQWTTKNFDLSLSDWMVTVNRTVKGNIIFLHPWFDGDIIMVDVGNGQPLNLINWTKPFDIAVWLLIIGTIIISALVHIFIQGFYKERGNRSIKTWFADNIYLSFMSFCSHFNHGTPHSSAGQIFLLSFAFWSFLVGAAYTANLASLLVENALTSEVSNLDEAMKQNLKICVQAGTAIESTVVETTNGRFGKYANKKHCGTSPEMYKSLSDGTCDLLLGTRQLHDVEKNEERYGCGLVEAGETIFSTHASFVTKLDPIRKCSTLLAYTLDMHLAAIDLDGRLSDLWETFIRNSKEDQCEGDERKLNKNRRELLTGSEPRELKAAKTVKTAAQQTNEEELNLHGMAGIFFLHAIGICMALCFVAGDYILGKSTSNKNEETEVRKPIVYKVGSSSSKKIKRTELKSNLARLKGEVSEMKRNYDTKNTELMDHLNALLDDCADIYHC